MIKRLVHIPVGALMCLLAIGGALSAAESEVIRACKTDLTSKNFRTLHTLIRPQENEWRHLKVQWMTDVVAARKKAMAEDKPIVICYTGGAGYNEPLGVC